MNRRPSSPLLRLHRDQRGSLSPMILTVVIVLAYMIVWILNTGQTIYDKQRTQDTADAVALVQADWTARSLNVMAMNNVGASQATVIGATAVAFQATTLEFGERSAEIIEKLEKYMNDHEAWGPPSLVPPMPPMPPCPYYQYIVIDFGIIHKACLAFQGFRMTMAAAAIGYVAYTEVHYNPLAVMAKAFEIINTMNAANKDLFDNLPKRVAANAMTVAHVNDVDHVVFHPPCADAESCSPGSEGQGGDLPVERGIDKDVFAFAEMCYAIEHGSGNDPLPQTQALPPMRDAYQQRGFAMGKGPLTGGGSGDNPHIRDHVNDATELDQWLPNWQTFYDAFGPAYYSNIPFKDIIKKYLPEDDKFSWDVFGVTVFDWEDAVDLGLGVIEDAFGIKFGVVNPFQLPLDKPPRYEDSQEAKENDFTRKFDSLWDDLCGAKIGGLLSEFGVLPTPYWLKGRTPLSYDPISSRISGDQLTDYRSLAVVSRAPRKRLQKGLFKDAAPSAYAFAESWTHNHTAFDLYTQNWRATLAPASRVDDDDLTDTLRASPASSAFDRLVNIIDEGGADGIAALTTH